MTLVTENGERMRANEPPPPSMVTNPQSDLFFDCALMGMLTVVGIPCLIMTLPFALLGWLIKKAAKPKGNEP
jgi:hypothetical protein